MNSRAPALLHHEPARMNSEGMRSETSGAMMEGAEGAEGRRLERFAFMLEKGCSVRAKVPRPETRTSEPGAVSGCYDIRVMVFGARGGFGLGPPGFTGVREV